MWKTILTFSAATLLTLSSLFAQGHRSGEFASSHGSYAHGGSGHHYGGGRYYYFGGVPFFYPFYDAGFGYPFYSYDYGSGYPGFPGEAPYGEAPYEGRIANGSAPGEGGPSLPTVVQQQLAKRGYYKGPVDGKFGPASRGALSRFQHQNGLQETGRIDEPTLMALGFSDRR